MLKLKKKVEGAADRDLFGQMGSMHRRKVWERYLAVRDRAASGLSQSQWVLCKSKILRAFLGEGHPLFYSIQLLTLKLPRNSGKELLREQNV